MRIYLFTTPFSGLCAKVKNDLELGGVMAIELEFDKFQPLAKKYCVTANDTPAVVVVGDDFIFRSVGEVDVERIRGLVNLV